MPAIIGSALSVLLLVFGFGFVIFFHELGHFLAAKWADVKVEQFAVGFGQSLCSWRQGLGFRWGSTQIEFHERLTRHVEQKLTDQLKTDQKESITGPTEEQIARAATELNISETEYRLNWIPLGGYVKMLGQDDLKPGVTVSDPRSYNSKTIGQRMVIVSAGVIMNVILAAIGFMIVFLMGLESAPPIVGAVLPGSPAQLAYHSVNGVEQPSPLQPGDKILTLDGRPQADFTKIGMNVALAAEATPIPMDVLRVDGTRDKVWILPAKPTDESKKGFLMLGIEQAYELEGIDKDDAKHIEDSPALDHGLFDPLAVKPGERIVKISGTTVKDPQDFYLLNDAMQTSGGKEVQLTVADHAGHQRVVAVRPIFAEPFSTDDVNFAGMLPRTLVASIQKDSPAEVAGFQPGDVIVEAASDSPGGDRQLNPSRKTLVEWFKDSGERNEPVLVKVWRNGQVITLKSVVPSLQVERGRKGMGLGLLPEQSEAIVAALIPNSPATIPDIPPGAKINSVDGHPTTSWDDVDTALKQIPAGRQFIVQAEVNGHQQPYTFRPLSQAEAVEVHENRYESPYPGELLLHDYPFIRQTHDPLVAAQWGLGETRDSIVQVYLTVRRMIEGSVSYKNVSGPVGILKAGYGFANKGLSWLIWFLSIISANLAVMNFLPIPIVDGGLFSFLIIEKIKGGPLSPRVQAVAQVVGLAILLSVFLLATYQDLFR